MKVYDALSNKLVEDKDIQLAEKLIHLKKTKDVWTVIRYIVDAWKKESPARWDSFLFSIKEKQKSRYNSYGSSKSKNLRYLIDMPTKVYQLIRVLYPVEELSMDKKFFREFAKRIKEFTVPEKIWGQK